VQRCSGLVGVVGFECYCYWFCMVALKCNVWFMDVSKTIILFNGVVCWLCRLCGGFECL